MTEDAMAPPEINPITKDVSDFVDEIDDAVIRTKLQDLIAIAQESDGVNRFARDVAMVDSATARWQLANANQRKALDRLLEERAGHLEELRVLRARVRAFENINLKESVGPE